MELYRLFHDFILPWILIVSRAPGLGAYYNLVFKTGDSGTDEDVYAQIIAYYSRSNIKILKVKDKSLSFKPGSIDKFSVFTTDYGVIEKVVVGLAKTPPDREWNLSSVSIIDHFRDDVITTNSSSWLLSNQHRRKSPSIYQVLSYPVYAQIAPTVMIGMNGLWSMWAPWSACSQSCGRGKSTRVRRCDNPRPTPSGEDCNGTDTEGVKCSTDPCPVTGGWSAWSLWQHCSVTCGNGFQSRSRSCDSPAPARGGATCKGSEESAKPCKSPIECPINGNWGGWKAWSTCSVTCSIGTRMRSRDCDNPAPRHNGRSCEGSAIQTERCDSRVQCPVNGGWSSWNDWSQCAGNCWMGRTSRSRSCDSPDPAHGGIGCPGDGEEERECPLKPCPVHGFWGPWSPWDQCDEHCGKGANRRSRLCDSPAPKHGGRPCEGDNQETRECFLRPCPVHGSWGPWNPWNSCSVTCGPGSRSRTRLCDSPEPAHGGNYCSGESMEREDCKIKNCPVHGRWSSWNPWSPCTTSCGADSSKTRTRACSSPRPSFGGDSCLGDVMEKALCMKKPCPVHGSWSAWGPWSNCSVACDSGIRTHQRLCSDPAPQYGGRGCRGKDTESEVCEEKSCVDPEDNFKSAMADLFGSDNESLSLADVSSKTDELFKSLDSLNRKYVVLEMDGCQIGMAQFGDNSTRQTVETKMMSLSFGADFMNNIFDATEGAVKLKFASFDSTKLKKENETEELEVECPVVKLQIEQESGAKVEDVKDVEFDLGLPNTGGPKEDDVIANKMTLTPGKSITQNVTIVTRGCTVQAFFQLPDDVISDYRLKVNINETAGAEFTIFANKTVEQTGRGELNVINVTAYFQDGASNLVVMVPGKQAVPAPFNAIMSLTLIPGANSSHIIKRRHKRSIENDTDVGSSVGLGAVAFTPKVLDPVTNEWIEVPDGLEVSRDSSIKNVKFKSNFFGCFSANIFVPPNTIDFSTVFDNFGAKLAENFTVLLSICIMIGCFIFCGIIMHRKDRKDDILFQFEPLADNDPQHVYTYTMTAFTGVKTGAGTTSRIHFELIGEWGSTGHRIMSDGFRENFATGSVSNFVLTTQAPLGRLIRMRIWIEERGRNPDPGWFLEKVNVEEVHMERIFTFMCNQWFDKRRDDHKTSRTLPEISHDKKYLAFIHRSKVNGAMDNHVVLSLFRKTGQSDYTRTQRLSVFFCMLAMVMVANAMWFKTDSVEGANVNFEIQLGPMTVKWHELYTGFLSVIMVYPPMMVIAEIFRRTKRWKMKRRSQLEARDAHLLPRWCIFIAWFLVFVTLFLSLFFTFLYSMQWGPEKANEWLKTFCLSIFQIVFLMDPVALLLTYLFMRKIVDGLKNSNKVSHADIVDGILDKNSAQAKRMKRERENQKRLSSTIRELTLFVMYLFLLLVICSESRDSLTYWQNKALKELFGLSPPPELCKMKTFDEYWDWVHKKILPNIYPTAGYNNEELNGTALDFVTGHQHLRLGPSRIRQKRVKEGSCRAPMRELRRLTRCNPGYSKDSEDKASYLPNWVNVSADLHKKTEKSDPFVRAFHYRSPEELRALPVAGEIYEYDGGGYAITLGTDYAGAAAILNRLFHTNWLDELTRFVIIEFTLFNGFTNLFSSVKIIAEVPETGGIFIIQQGVETYRLYNYVGGIGLVLMMIQSIWLVVVTATCAQTVIGICKHRGKFFKNFWNVVELTNLFCAIMILVTFSIRISMTIHAVEELKNNQGKFVIFDYVISWVKATVLFLSLEAFISIMRLFKFLGFNRHIAMLSATLKISAFDVASFNMLFAIVLMAYLTAGHMFFGHMYGMFRDCWRSLEVLFGMSLGPLTFNDIFEDDHNVLYLSRTFYTTFNVIVKIGLLSLFISLLNDTYSMVLANENLYKYDKELVEHMRERIKLLWGIFEGRLTSAIPERKKEEKEPQDRPVEIMGRKRSIMITDNNLKSMLKNVDETVLAITTRVDLIEYLVTQMENNMSVGERFQYFRDLDQTRFCKLDPGDIYEQQETTFNICNDVTSSPDEKDVKAVTFATRLKDSNSQSELTKDVSLQVKSKGLQGQGTLTLEDEKWKYRTSEWNYDLKTEDGQVPDPLIVAEVGTCLFHPNVSESVVNGNETLIHMPDSDSVGLLDSVRESDRVVGLVPITYSIPHSGDLSLPAPIQKKLETIGIILDGDGTDVDGEHHLAMPNDAEFGQHQVAHSSQSGLPPISPPMDGAGDCREITKLDDEIGRLNLFQDPQHNYCEMVWDGSNDKIPLIFMPDEK